MALKELTYQNCLLSIKEQRTLCIYAFNLETVAELTEEESLSAIRKDLEALGLSQALLFEGGNPIPHLIPCNKKDCIMTQLSNKLQELIWISSDIGISEPIIKVLGEIVTSKYASGLTRISDYRQMIINKNLADNLPCSPQEAVKRDIRNFAYLPDLADLEQTTTQRGGEGQTFEFSYRAALDEEKQNWRRFTNRYRVVVDRFGVPFRVAEVLGLDEATAPVLV